MPCSIHDRVTVIDYLWHSQIDMAVIFGLLCAMECNVLLHLQENIQASSCAKLMFLKGEGIFEALGASIEGESTVLRDEPIEY